MPAASGVDAEALRAAAQNVDADAGPAFPMWVLPVKKLLELEEIITHEALQAQGSLVRWEPGMQTLFVSHTWLRHNHPDGVNKEKLIREINAAVDDSPGLAREAVKNSARSRSTKASIAKTLYDGVFDIILQQFNTYVGQDARFWDQTKHT